MTSKQLDPKQPTRTGGVSPPVLIAPAVVVLLLMLLIVLDPQRTQTDLSEDLGEETLELAERLPPTGRFDRFMIRAGHNYTMSLSCHLDRANPTGDHPGLYAARDEWLNRGVQVQILEQSISESQQFTWGHDDEPLDLGMDPAELGELLRTEVAERYRRRYRSKLPVDELRRIEMVSYQLAAKVALYLPRSLGRTHDDWTSEPHVAGRARQGLRIELHSAAVKGRGVALGFYSTDEEGQYLLKLVTRGDCDKHKDNDWPGFAPPVWVAP